MRIGILSISTENMMEAYPHDFEGRLEITYQAAKTALESLGHSVKMLYVNPATLNTIKKDEFDVLLNFCDEGFFNNPLLEPHVAAHLDVMNLPYTGSDYFTLALCLNKVLTKKLMLYHRINTPRFQEFFSGNEPTSRALEFPLIVKPSKQDGSVGIKTNSVVRNEQQLRKKVKEVLSLYKQSALVEEYIEGREFNVAILGHDDKIEVLPISEIDFSELPADFEKILAYEAKWNTGSLIYRKTPPVCPAKIDPELYEDLVDMAIKAFKVTGCKDYARIDFRVDDKGTPYVLEINPNPDPSEDAGIANMASKIGLSYGQLLEKIVRSCAERNNIQNNIQNDIPIEARTKESDTTDS